MVHPLCMKQHSRTIMNIERDVKQTLSDLKRSTFNKRLYVFARHDKVQLELESPRACLCGYIYFRSGHSILFLITCLLTWKAAHYFYSCFYSCLKAIHEQFTHLFFSPHLWLQKEWYMPKWTEEMVLGFHTEGQVVWAFLIFQQNF